MNGTKGEDKEMLRAPIFENVSSVLHNPSHCSIATSHIGLAFLQRFRCQGKIRNRFSEPLAIYVTRNSHREAALRPHFIIHSPMLLSTVDMIR